MDLLFPRLKTWQYVFLTCLLVLCLVDRLSGASPDSFLVYAEPFSLIAGGIAMGAVSGGMQLWGQHQAQEAYENSAIGKAEAQIARQQMKIAKKPLSKLGLSEGQKRKAVTMALEQARSQKRQLEAQQERAKDIRGPARSGIEAIQDTQLRDAMLRAGAAARTDIESQSARLALARKQGAQGVIMPMAQARRAQMMQQGALLGQTVAGGIAGGMTAGMGYYAGQGMGAGAGAGAGAGTGAGVGSSAVTATGGAPVTP